MKPIKTVLIGFGKSASGYADDPRTHHYYTYTTHAQVVRDHSAFSWGAVVDPSKAARRSAEQNWNVPIAVGDVRELAGLYEPELAVIATPPDIRFGLLEYLPSVRAVLVEKPLALSLSDACRFLDLCQRRKILVQTGYWRRADQRFRALADGSLEELIGSAQTAFGVYGNGLLNNGAHLIDLVRMLLGRIACVQCVGEAFSMDAGPIPGDINISFGMQLETGQMVFLQPIDFRRYREVSLDIWGRNGRLAFFNEGLNIFLHPVKDNRALSGEKEIGHDQPEILPSTVGFAFYRLYDNLAMVMRKECKSLWSPGDSALETARVVEAVVRSAKGHNSVIHLDDLQP